MIDLIKNYYLQYFKTYYKLHIPNSSNGYNLGNEEFIIPRWKYNLIRYFINRDNVSHKVQVKHPDRIRFLTLNNDNLQFPEITKDLLKYDWEYRRTEDDKIYIYKKNKKVKTINECKTVINQIDNLFI